MKHYCGAIYWWLSKMNGGFIITSGLVVVFDNLVG